MGIATLTWTTKKLRTDKIIKQYIEINIGKQNKLKYGLLQSHPTRIAYTSQQKYIDKHEMNTILVLVRTDQSSLLLKLSVPRVIIQYQQPCDYKAFIHYRALTIRKLQCIMGNGGSTPIKWTCLKWAKSSETFTLKNHPYFSGTIIQNVLTNLKSLYIILLTL